MITLDAFLQAILGIEDAPAGPIALTAVEDDPDDIMGEHGGIRAAPVALTALSGFARHLLERTFAAPAKSLTTATTITTLQEDPGVRSLPQGLWYWPVDEVAGRIYHTLLVEVEGSAQTLLDDRLFAQERKEGRVEDAVHRLVQTVLRGFEHKNEATVSNIQKARQHRTLVVVSVLDDLRPSDADRRWKPAHLVCFGTRWVPKSDREMDKRAPPSAHLATFTIREEVRFWEEESRAKEHLTALYTRHFFRLDQRLDWQDAFARDQERKLLAELSLAWKQQQIGSSVADEVKTKLLALLDEMAGSYGFRAKKQERVTFEDLPETHDIGATDTEALEAKFRNKIDASRLFRADNNRLLGYFLVVVVQTKQARALEERLAASNRYHNVLVVAHNETEGVVFDLWQGTRKLRGRLVEGDGRTAFDGPGGNIHLLSRFFVVSRSTIQTPQKLAEELAYRAVKLRRLAARELAAEEKKGEGKLLKLRASFSASLAQLDDDGFVDAYAQTLAYGLLTARWLSHTEPERFTREEVPKLLPTTTPFLAALFNKLVKTNFDVNLDWIIDDIVGLLGRTAVREVFEGQAGEVAKDPSIHFYEDFLDKYDPQLRKERGVYYTPDEVVSYIVNTAHTALQERFGLRLGLADPTTWAEFAKTRGIAVPKGIKPTEPFVQILDPSTGTGTFLLRVIEVIHATMMAEYDSKGWDAAKRLKEWRAYVRDNLLPRVNGFEIMVAPYMVCHLRLGLALERTGFVFGRGKERDSERLHVYLTDTLEFVDKAQQGLGDTAVAKEARDAEWAKKDAPISVVVGNPPYERESAESDGGHKAGWVRDGGSDWRGGRAPLEDYTEPTRKEGAGGHLKNIYNLYVYFWRWAGWRVFDRHDAPGIVSFITASSYLRGPGFTGMREEMRRSADEIYVLDLEGDQRGTRVTENVFCITIPVCVGTLLAERVDRTTPARARYRRIAGTREEKLTACLAIMTLTSSTGSAVPTRWQDPLMAGGSAQYDYWPLVTGLLPWQHSGAQYKRTWPIGATAAVLEDRWTNFLKSDDRAAAFRETGAWTIHSTFKPLFNDEIEKAVLATLSRKAPVPRLERYGFRSFDCQYAFADERLGDRLRPPLWHVSGGGQIYLTSLLSGVIGQGPGATVSAYVPDLHYFRGSYGGKDVIPLWRDPEATQPNLAAGFLAALTAAHGCPAKPEDIFAYVYALLANPGYVRRFSEELQVPGPRLPVTKVKALFDRGAALGHTLLRWHTYGERFRRKGDGFKLTGKAKVRTAIPETPAGYPERHRYDQKTQVLQVGDGQIGPVSPEVMSFSVSGLQVVKSWLDYRMKKGAGKKSSPLDDIRPERWTEELTRELLELLWVLEWTLEQYPTLDAWLEEVLASELFTAAEIPSPTEAERKEPKVQRGKRGDLPGLDGD